MLSLTTPTAPRKCSILIRIILLFAFMKSIVQAALIDSKAINTRNILLRWTSRDNFGVCHEIQVRKCRAKIRSINIRLPCALWEEQSMTTGTKYIDSVIPWHVAQPHRQYRLSLAVHMWTPTKRGTAILLVHGIHPPTCKDVPRMYHPIKHLRRIEKCFR